MMYSQPDRFVYFAEQVIKVSLVQNVSLKKKDKMFCLNLQLKQFDTPDTFLVEKFATKEQAVERMKFFASELNGCVPLTCY